MSDELQIPVAAGRWQEIRDDEDKLRELVLCAQSFRHFLKHWWFLDQETKRPRRLGEILWDGQEDFVSAMAKHNFIYALKARKLGFTTLEQAEDAWVMRFRGPNERVHLFSRREDAANELLGAVKYGLDRLPDWMQLPYAKKAQNEIRLVGGTDDTRVAKAYPADEDTAVEATCTHGHVDEWARMNNPQRVWQAIEPTMAGSCRLITTGMGPGNYASTFWTMTQAGDTDFHPFFVNALRRSGRNEAWLRAKRKSMPEADSRREYPMCVIPSTRIGTGVGIRPISKVNVGDETSFGKIEHAFRETQKDVLAVETLMGYRLLCSPDHGIFAPDGSCTKAKDLMSGATVQLAQPDLAHGPHVLKWDRGAVESSIEITPELGELLGFFLGDGSDALTIVCDAQDEDVIERVTDLQRMCLGAEPRRKKHHTANAVYITTQNSAVRELLWHLGISRPRIGSTDPAAQNWQSNRWLRRVTVPTVIMQSPASVVSSFLSGYFEADGCCKQSGAVGASMSHHSQTLRDVHLLLLSLGITSRLHWSMGPRSSENREYSAGSINLRMHEAALFHRKIGFVGERKRSRAIDVNSACDMEDEVKSIVASGSSKTLDISVKGTHRYVANGIVVHNSWKDSLFAGADMPLAGDALEKCGTAGVGRQLLPLPGHEYTKSWDVGRHKDAAVCTVIDRSTQPLQVVEYIRLRNLPYPVLQQRIEELHEIYPGMTVLEDNAAGEAVRENLDISPKEVHGHKTTNVSKPRMIKKLEVGISNFDIAWSKNDFPQLHLELDTYTIPDDYIVQDSVMSLAIGVDYITDPKYRPKKKGRVRRVFTV